MGVPSIETSQQHMVRWGSQWSSDTTPPPPTRAPQEPSILELAFEFGSLAGGLSPVLFAASPGQAWVLVIQVGGEFQTSIVSLGVNKIQGRGKMPQYGRVPQEMGFYFKCRETKRNKRLKILAWGVVWTEQWSPCLFRTWEEMNLPGGGTSCGGSQDVSSVLLLRAVCVDGD